MKSFFQKNKKATESILIIIFSIAFLSYANIAWAGPIDAAVTMVVGWVASLIILVCGWILGLAISAILTIASYNKFVSEPSIIQAWVVVRDLCNMFFILILLVIAFATILRLPSYEWKKLLPKLLIMAVLINFSKTICGLLIDFSQVVMLTFTNAFSDGGGNFINMLGVQKFLSIAKDQSSFFGTTPSSLNLTNTAAAMVFVIILMVVATVAMLAIMIIFLIRMIMLWIYIILSPLAFLLMAFPQGQKYASDWWSEFIKYLINGPVLAFFIWLALIVTSPGNAPKFESSIFFDPKVGSLQSANPQIILALQSPTFINFILAIGLLVGGLMMSQQIGGLGAAWGMNALNSLKTTGLGIAKKGAMLPLLGAKTLGSYGIDKLHEYTGVDLNVGRVWKGIQAKREDIRKKRYGKGMIKAQEAMREGGRFYGAMAMTGTPGSAWEQLTTKAGWRRRRIGGKNAKEEIEKLEAERKTHKEAISQAENNEKYQAAQKVISEYIAPEDRTKLTEEQSSLEKALRELDADIKAKESKLNDKEYVKGMSSIELSAMRGELENQTNERDNKLDQYNRNKKELEKPERSEKDLNEAQKTVEFYETKIKARKEEIGKIDDRALTFKPIMDFEAISMQGALEAEEMKKIEHIKDKDELSSMARDAMKSGDKIRFNAIGLKLAKDGNENDGLLNNLGYNSNAEGLQKMMHDISHEYIEDEHGNKVKSKNYMGYSEQDAMALGMKLSYAAEGNNHWATARAFTMEDGRYRNSSKKEQTMAAVSEVAKMDPQQIALRLNRLGYGGETPDGKFILDEFGLALLKTVAPKVAEQMNRFSPNAAPRLNTTENVKLMVQVGVDPIFINGLKGKGRAPIMKADESIIDLEKQGYFKKKV